MTHILAFDTTSKHPSISISRGYDILVEYKFTTTEKLSASLLPKIEFVLNSTGLKPRDIDVYGIAIGPGLFTGIRVGLATLKGLLFGQNKPVVPIVTLKALAYKYIKGNFTVIPLIDARREEVYFAGYNCFNDEIKEIICPQLIHINKLKKKLNGIEKVLIVDSITEAHSPFLAPEICKIAHEKFLERDYIEDLQKLIPFYVRKPDAEQNYSKP